MADISLAALLRAVERCQQDPPWEDNVSELCQFDIAGLRAAAHQHAEALREISEFGLGSSHDDSRWLRAAANFLDGGKA